MMKALKLSQNKVAIIDDEDFEYFNQWKWSYHSGGYAYRWIRTIKPNQISLLHRAIINPPEGFDIDHINHDGLDNRKENLRICTASQNSANHRQKPGASGLFGVCWDKQMKKWRATATIKHKTQFLGLFEDKMEAARVRDAWVKEKFGEFGRYNNV